MIIRKTVVPPGFAGLLLLLLPFFVSADHDEKKHGEFYFSWGYNTEWYTRSDVKVSQPELGNEYVFVKITGHDHPGWNDRIFQKPISVPQYNYRLGYFFKEKNDLG